jgi:Putative MetA-pathway of phenol degradation
MSVTAGFRIWLLSMVLAAFAGPGISRADAGGCPTSGSDIATDRPDVTNSSLVVPAGSLQGESGINLSARRDVQILDGTNSRLRLGVAPCLEVLVDLPSYFAAPRGHAGSGFSNVAPAVKWQISPVPGKVDLSATFGVGLPTGTSAIAGPGAQPYVQFPWSYELTGGWGLSGMVTTFFRPSDPVAKLSQEATFVVERKIGERAALFVEYVGDFPDRGGPSHLINSGGLYRVTPTQQLDFHVGFGLNRNAPDYFFGLGYSFRIDGLF